MACKREVLGCIIGVQEVISYLSGQTDSTETSNAMEDDTGWQDNDPASWGWGDEDAMDTSQSAAEPAPSAGGGGGDPDWLDAATVAVSPLGDVLAAATDRRVVLLAGQWDSESGQSRFVVSARLEAPEASVTSLLCLPLASNQRSSSGAADWTCLVVGQESGHLTFYTEDGSLLFRQRLHESAVLSVSCSSRQVSPSADEELTVVFEDAVVVVDGFSLYQTLRACRNQLARVRAGGGGGLDVPPLARAKWELRLQQRTETAQNVGHRSTALLDHLLQQSLHRPASNVTNAAVPAGALLVTTGRCPFVGFYHAAEGVEQARLDQVFRGVASKVKDTVFSTIGSFWSSGSGQRDPAKEQEELEPGKPIDCKFGLPDVQRQGQLMALSRDRQLSAVTDSFGRVTLIDNHSGVALHMWKGYRDAECGWLEVRESRSSSSARRPAPGQDAPPARRTRFLALYAPRRGLLEVWSAVGGPKVAAFNVSKHGRLVNVSHGLIGVSEGDGAARKAPKLLQCVFLSSDGRLSTLNVPFHLALSERSSRRAHGQHLLRELRAQLRAPPADAAGYLRSQLAALRTASARHQAMDAALACRRLNAGDMEAAVDAVLDAYTAQEPASLDHDSQTLLQTAMAYRRLLTAYCALEKLEAAPPPYEKTDDEISTQELSELLRLSPERTAELVSRLDPAPGSPEAEEPRARVTFAAERRAGPAAFLACLEVTAPHGQPAVGVRETLTEDERRELATLLFGACLSLPAPSPEWRSAVLRCGVPAAQLLRLLAACWLDCCAPLRPRHLAGLAATLTAVVAETGQSWSRSNSTSSNSGGNTSGGGNGGGGAVLWQTAQEQITEAIELRRALTLATVCRAVAVRMEEERYAATLEKRFGKAAEAGEDVPEPTPSETVSGDWEQLTEQTVSWDLLLHQLSDVSALCDVIPAAHRGSDVTLRALLKKGPGAVSELAARWLLEIGAQPVDLAPPPPPPASDADQEAPPEDASEAAAPAPAKEAKEEKAVAEWGREATEPDTEEGRRRQRIQDCISRIAARFPHSVRADTLLLNAAWEEAAAWNRHREHTERLSRAVAFAAHIGNAHLRYGACCLLWSALVCRPCATVAGLLQRAGRRPDDALCRREVQLPQLQLPQLMDACSELLEQLLKALVTSEVERAPVLYSDNLWAAAASRTDSLLDMAARQRPCSEDLAALQLQVADVMRAQVHLDLRGVHPYGCFTERDGTLLFGELSARYTPPSAVDQSVRSRREALLNRWVTAAVGLIAERPDGQAELTETAQWVRRCREVARGWDISVDVVNRQYTLDLYSAGHDHAAQEVLLSLGSAAGLPSQLLLLAGARVRHYIHSSSDMMPLLARLTMNCADFIKIADVPLQCPSVPLERTLALLRHVVRLHPDSASECRLAMEMVDLTESLMSDSDKWKR